ncbi:NADH-dependent FMN reductase RutF [Agrobacterium radiobacter]|jgi:flavin reductase|uniref:FMN reductase (NADH) RutF n=1 Tax=Agrobacterium tumefaciens str. Kerr 14 TaxID=1183424 RepID=A0A1S7P4W2_AGRTU|nr:pyrimidine utilization flavin reductase protein F [Agrobacterium tumefaciens]AYM82011.1 flavoprotein oxidoreductase [Agrobacterium tumefaciens]EHH07306.1 4-hydroxyphenylacetate-3-hydroxylase small chain [Agrobacterium tumefaciens CCNWGS0286]MBP2508686.1 flavin reductase [Agrobacterium tumefaciens]MBP2594827.1 flavin reductase [Agrobacterium tumefaciens]NTE92686.1 pyrimidine utilization flavin reductase protein F [Agrobacterium tumefaciens]
MRMMSLEKEAEMETKTAEQRSLEYRNAMARLGAAVNIVTTDGVAGRAGFAATAVCSVSDNPPTLLVCLNRNASAYKVVKSNGVICVNTLASKHEALSTLFGGKTPAEERFAAGTWGVLETGAPVLEDALVSFDCRIREAHDGGTHDILICDVVDMKINEGEEALLYFNRRYRVL